MSAKLDAMFRAHHGFVWSTLRGLGCDEATADDLVQEVFLVVARLVGGYDDRGTPRAWLYSIVRRVLADARKRRGRTRAREDRWAAQRSLDVSDGRINPERVAALAEGAARVESFLDGLPAKQREVFVLMELQHMTAAEVAQAIAARPNTVYSRLRLARKAFAAAFGVPVAAPTSAQSSTATVSP